MVYPDDQLIFDPTEELMGDYPQEPTRRGRSTADMSLEELMQLADENEQVQTHLGPLPPYDQEPFQQYEAPQQQVQQPEVQQQEVSQLIPFDASTIADGYCPEIGWWYNEASGPGNGAWYHKSIGWHFRVCAADGSFPTSNVSTPIAGPGHGAFNPTQTVPTYQPMAPQVQQPYFGGAPTLAVPQAPQRSASQSTRVSSKRRTTAVEGAKKVSIKQTCICGDGAVAEKIPRPRNMWILYRTYHSAKVRDANAQHMREGRRDLVVPQPSISKRLAEQWKNESAEVKAIWQDKADREAAMHKQLHPDYKYAPGSSKLQKFGDENCTCGAYEVNTEHMRSKKSSKRARVDYRAAAEEEEAEFDTIQVAPQMPTTYGYPPAQSESSQRPKRKRASRDDEADAPEEPQPVRRSTRGTRNKSPSYQDTEMDDQRRPVSQHQHVPEFAPMNHAQPVQQRQAIPTHQSVQQQHQPIRSYQPVQVSQLVQAVQTQRTQAPAPTFSTDLHLPGHPARINTTAPQQQQPNSPARNTRSRSHTPRTPPATQHPDSPAHNTRSRSRSHTPKSNDVVMDDYDSAFDLSGQVNFDDGMLPEDLFGDSFEVDGRTIEVEEAHVQQVDETMQDFDEDADLSELFGEDAPQRRRSSSKKSSRGSAYSPSGRRRSTRIGGK